MLNAVFYTVDCRKHKHLKMTSLKNSKPKILNYQVAGIKTKSNWMRFNKIWRRSLPTKTSLKVNVLDYNKSMW